MWYKGDTSTTGKLFLVLSFSKPAKNLAEPIKSIFLLHEK